MDSLGNRLHKLGILLGSVAGGDREKLGGICFKPRIMQSHGKLWSWDGSSEMYQTEARGLDHYTHIYMSLDLGSSLGRGGPWARQLSPFEVANTSSSGSTT